MPASIGQKYDIILKRERSLAYRVFRKAVRLKPLGVWDVMIPFLFFLNVMKNKEIKELPKKKKGADYSRNFQFSILEAVDINANENHVFSREAHWKKVLLSREFGYNKN